LLLLVIIPKHTGGPVPDSQCKPKSATRETNSVPESWTKNNAQFRRRKHENLCLLQEEDWIYPQKTVQECTGKAKGGVLPIVILINDTAKGT
jgi:hypothetical protein